MGVVHPTCIGFGKDDASWSPLGAWSQLGAPWSEVVSLLSCIFVLRASATSDLARSPEYHLGLSSFRYMAGVSP